MGVYSQFKSCHYFNVCACTMYELLLSARPYSLKSNLFLAFGSLISNAEVENEIISDHIIVCPNLLEFDCWFLFCFFFLFSICAAS